MQRLWIGGRPVDAKGGARRTIHDPATLEAIDDTYDGSGEDVAAAVSTAVEAQAKWRTVPAVERARLLHEIALALREDRARLSELLTREGGKPRIENLDEVEWCAACFD